MKLIKDTFFFLIIIIFVSCDAREDKKIDRYLNKIEGIDKTKFEYIHVINSDGCEGCVFSQASRACSFVDSKAEYLVILSGKNYNSELIEILADCKIGYMVEDKNLIKSYIAGFTNGLIYNIRNEDFSIINEIEDYENYFK